MNVICSIPVYLAVRRWRKSEIHRPVQGLYPFDVRLQSALPLQLVDMEAHELPGSRQRLTAPGGEFPFLPRPPTTFAFERILPTDVVFGDAREHRVGEIARRPRRLLRGLRRGYPPHQAQPPRIGLDGEQRECEARAVVLGGKRHHLEQVQGACGRYSRENG